MFFNEDFYTNCSGVKHRKRKKKETQEDDIIALNHKVIQRFTTDIEDAKSRLKKISIELSQYKIPYGIEQKDIDIMITQLKEFQMTTPLDKSEKSGKKSVCYSEYKSLLQELKHLCKKNVLPLFEEYKCKIKPLIEEYENVLNKPVKINFFGKSTSEKNTELANIKEQIMHLISTYYPDIINGSIHKKEESQIQNTCPNCEHNDFVLEFNKQICTACGMEMESIQIDSEFVDVERVNFSKKYTYKKYIHFRDTLKNFQGKQNRIIDKSLIDRLEHEMIKDGIIDKIDEHSEIKTEKRNDRFDRYEKVKKEHIRIYLDQIGENKHYEDINLIYSQMTNLKNHSISSDLEEELLKDFELFTKTFLEISKEKSDIKRTNILSSSFILFQLLRRRGYKCKEEDFTLPTSQKCRYEQEYIYSLCCEKLGWNYVSIL